LVVALGNPLLGADGFGPAVADRLGRMPGFFEAAELLDVSTDLIGHLDTLAKHDRVILVDALVAAGRPGQVAVYEEQEFAAWSVMSPGCHAISPVMGLRLFRCLYPEATTRMSLVGLSVEFVERATELPDAAVELGARLVASLVDLCVS
jgi:hydrogenase maturation protease